MNDTSFGQFLRQAREDRGLTLEQAEEETKIRKFYLRALEEDNFSVMPAQVYAVGFVRKYCLFLGIDEQAMIHRYKQLSGGTKHEEEPVVVNPAGTYQVKPPFISRVSTKNLATTLIFLVVVLWLGSYVTDYFTNRIGERQPPNTNPPVTGQEPPPTKPIEEPPAQPEELVVTLEATARCWYLVRVDNGEAEQGTLASGDTKEYRGKEKIFVHLGNAGGAKVSVNGQEPVYLGASGAVAKQEFTLQ